MAGRIGARRELMEECGIDVGDTDSRLELAVFDSFDKKQQAGPLAALPNFYKGRLFYFLRLDDSDFLLSDEDGGVAPSGSEGSSLRLPLSDEHSMWKFFTEANLAVDLLTEYSGGKVSEALQLCLDSSVAPADATQTLLHSAFGGVAVAPETQNDNADDGENDGDDDDDSSNTDSQSTWGAPEKVNDEECSLLSTCQADPCSEPKVDACQLTGYVEKIGCKSPGDGSSMLTRYQSCTPATIETAQDAKRAFPVTFPLVFCALAVCLAVLALVWKRRSDRQKWIQRKSRYFDDDAFVVNSEGLELMDEPDDPMDLPPVD